MPNVTIAEETLEVWDNWLESTKTPPEPIVYKEDPVALAMASYRSWVESGNR